MKIETWKTKNVKPYEKNPRKNDDAVAAVAESIKAFGFQQPIVVDKDGVIIAGHTRHKAAKKLGLQDVPVVVAENLTEEQVKAYRLADNKSGEFASWDISALFEELEGIEEINMAAFGFDQPEEEQQEEAEQQPWDLVTLKFEFTPEEYADVDPILRAQGTPPSYKTNNSKKGNQLYAIFEKTAEGGA